ncbi:hypothetical protein [Desulfosporosinus sp. Sb-LF]|uniref:hypothetical protein n=1 Tax=Desulfosporosinus sp. Sb-LF TaxID=2560027 RepID=UPI00107F1A6F|nr:hypothetical protein [Desulfosporosinus sp. Sb-LF]TGE33120.1 hypothetical protein E4K68_09860 [Desulfosporosinus sp. Sb-LF]
MKKLIAVATTFTLLLTLTVPVLADDNSSTTNATQAPTSQSPTDKTTKAKERLQNEITKLQNQEQFQQYMGPVRDLQKQEVQIRAQIHTTRDQVRQQLKADRQAKNYTALLAALNDMIPLQDDIAGVETIAKICLTDWQQYHSDHQTKNVQGIQTDLQKLQTDIQTKIPAMQKVLADLQKVDQDLKTPAAPPSTSPSTTQSTTTVPASTPGTATTVQ